MNKTETLAYNWLLKEKGYNSKDIRFQFNKSPDFICTNGKTYEAKRLYNDKIIFYRSQKKKLEEHKSIILVFNEKTLVTEFPYELIKNDEPEEFNGIKLTWIGFISVANTKNKDGGYVVRPCGAGGLHVILSKSDFVLGETITVMKITEWERRIREIVQEEIQGLRQEY